LDARELNRRIEERGAGFVALGQFLRRQLIQPAPG
jgi:hypothetical protein